MTRRILNSLSRALGTSPAGRAHSDVHFHQGAQGNAAACFDARCDRPTLDVA